jgi:isopenicillin N synthase-like dioxygenase
MIDPVLQTKLVELSWKYFNLPQKRKQKLAMTAGGSAWRGYFKVGEELTSGKPDVKEGLYFGKELAPNHPLVVAKTPMHGANLFPDISEFKETVLDYLQAMTTLGHVIMRGIALSLGLHGDYFAQHYLDDPLILFRIFHYPKLKEEHKKQALWGVGEHTDYGVLTILKQDHVGGLQVKKDNHLIAAPYIDNTFICNIGDMLDRITQGYYRSTPHRVLNTSGEGRLSFPFFFDPNYQKSVFPADLSHLKDFKPQQHQRWDQADLSQLEGTYGDYLLNKVGKVFPQLFEGLDL